MEVRRANHYTKQAVEMLKHLCIPEGCVFLLLCNRYVFVKFIDLIDDFGYKFDE